MNNPHATAFDVQGLAMETVIARLHTDFENGTLTRLPREDGLWFGGIDDRQLRPAPVALAATAPVSFGAVPTADGAFDQYRSARVKAQSRASSQARHCKRPTAGNP